MDKKQYGWAICMACALLLFCTAGLAQTGFSAYQPYLTRIGGLTNTQASTVVLFRNLFGLAGMLAVTPLIRRFEVRRIVTCGILLCGVSFLAYGFSRSFFGYCGAAALSGCGLGLGGMIPASVLISRWLTTVSISMYAAGAATEESYPATVTKYQVLSTLGALLFGVVPGATADRTGDYVLAFVIMLILTIAGAVIVQTAYHAIGKENRKLTEGRL